MPDVFTPAKRSAVMSLIRSTGNAATELRLMALLRAGKITGWRRHLSLPLPPPKAKARAGEKKPRKPRVRPDFVFRQQRLAVFVDGCFWHGCPRHATRPRQNRQFWDEKIARNRQRDRHVTRALRQSGWTVLRLWECALTKKQQPRTMSRLRRALGGPKIQITKLVIPFATSSATLQHHECCLSRQEMRVHLGRHVCR